MSLDPTDYRLIVSAGTYEGVLAGWEIDFSQPEDERFQISFASPVHDGSIRCVSTACSDDSKKPGVLLSCGYDEMLRTHDFTKHMTGIGEVRTPADFGTPVCSGFAPPMGSVSTHCLLGFSDGKLVIYKKRDWSVQHVLAGHEHGIASMAVHPSGKMALTGGVSDGKLKLWDLTKGRLAYANKIKGKHEAVVTLVWNSQGTVYAFGHGSHITVKDVASGSDLLDVEMPSRVNQVCFMEGPKGLFVAAACNDGSLPLLAVPETATDEILALMAIEPVDGPVAGEERFKCIQSAMEYCVVTSNSAGVISLYNLEGAVNMILKDKEAAEKGDGTSEDDEVIESEDSDDSSSESEGEEELAVDILGSTQLGSGARVTSLSVWYCEADEKGSEEGEEEEQENAAEEVSNNRKRSGTDKGDGASKRKRDNTPREVVMDNEALEKARKLVSKAKKIQKRKENKKNDKKKTKKEKQSR